MGKFDRPKRERQKWPDKSNKKSDRFSNDKGSNSHGGSKSDRSGSRTQLFAATCANCGEGCQVPFQPTGSRPVLCRDCFRKSDRGSIGKPDGFIKSTPLAHQPSTRQKDDFRPDSVQRELANINQKLDRILRMLEEN